MPAALREVDHLMQEALARHVFPGAVLTVTRGEDLVVDKAFGLADLFSGRAMRRDTFFDLASLTKPLATVLAVMGLVRKGHLDLDQACGELIPQVIGADKGAITIRHLLQHRSGLPPWKPFFMRLRDMDFEQRRPALQELLRQTSLRSPVGKCSDYSDLGFMVLQWIVESTAGTDLAQAVREMVYAPLGIDGLFFNDTRQPVPGTERYAATQLCPWRQKLMLGHVDDDNAYICGGTAGHAGLFGTAAAVARLLQALLVADHGGGAEEVFDTSLVKQFWGSETAERWALGFDTPAQSGSSAGRHFPPDSVGHLGFSGTSFWVHRAKKVVVVLLTNRVHPWRYNEGIKVFRPRLHDVVMESIAAN